MLLHSVSQATKCIHLKAKVYITQEIERYILQILNIIAILYFVIGDAIT